MAIINEEFFFLTVFGVPCYLLYLLYRVPQCARPSVHFDHQLPFSLRAARAPNYTKRYNTTTTNTTTTKHFMRSFCVTEITPFCWGIVDRSDEQATNRCCCYPRRRSAPALILIGHGSGGLPKSNYWRWWRGTRWTATRIDLVALFHMPYVVPPPSSFASSTANSGHRESAGFISMCLSIYIYSENHLLLQPIVDSR